MSKGLQGSGDSALKEPKPARQKAFTVSAPQTTTLSYMPARMSLAANTCAVTPEMQALHTTMGGVTIPRCRAIFPAHSPGAE